MAESWQNSILLVCLRKFVRTVREPRKHWISSESVQIHQIVHTHLYECASVPQLWVVQHNHWSHGWPWSHYLRELCSLWWQLRHQSHWSNPVQIWCSKSSQTSQDLGWLVHCVGFIHESSLIYFPPLKIWARDVWSPDPIPFLCNVALSPHQCYHTWQDHPSVGWWASWTQNVTYIHELP